MRVMPIFCIIVPLVVVLVIPCLTGENEHVIRKEVFRTKKIISVWEEAVKVLKGEKLKSLMTELKAHEKLLLSLKKKRHTTMTETPDTDKDWDDWDGSSFAKVPSKPKSGKILSQQQQQDDDEERLQQDLAGILERFHLPVNLAKRNNDRNSDPDKFDSSDNHVNSVLHDEDGNRKKVGFEESRAMDLYKQAIDLRDDIAAVASKDTSEGSRRLKEYNDWLTMSLERDLDMLENRLKKYRHLEQQLDQLKRDWHQRKGLSEEMDSSAQMEDLRKRLKDLKYKSEKSEKEIRERIHARRSAEFPNSRASGDL